MLCQIFAVEAAKELATL